MKKIVALLLGTMLVLSMTGCVGGEIALPIGEEDIAAIGAQVTAVEEQLNNLNQTVTDITGVIANVGESVVEIGQIASDAFAAPVQ